MTTYNYTYVIEAIDTNPNASSGPYVKVVFSAPNRIIVPFQFYPRNRTDAELIAYIESDLAKQAVQVWLGQEEMAQAAADAAAELAASELTQDPVGVEVSGSLEITPFVASTIPSYVSMRQARLALKQQGLLATVQSNIEALPEDAQIEWEYAAQVERGSDLVATLGAALGLTEDQLDDLFKLAVTL